MQAVQTEKQKIDQLASGFGNIMQQLIQNTQHELEVALAMNDSETSTKAQTKRDAWQLVYDRFNEASNEPSLEAVALRYGQLIEAARQEVQRRLEQALAVGDKDMAIKEQIYANILGKPVHGLFTSRFRQVAGGLPSVSPWREVARGHEASS